MKILSRLMAHFGYVRLKDYGYELSASGRIVEVVKVEDDRFAPPPWQPLGLPSAVSLLPPAPAKPPMPRPLAPPPDESAAEADPQPLFKIPGATATVETQAPGPAAADDDPISIDEAPPPEEEEWEWKMALARAREIAEKEKKEKDKRDRMTARRGQGSSFQTSALPLAPPRTSKVMESPRPMSATVQPARERDGGPRPEPRKDARPAAPEPRKAPEPRTPIARVEPRAATGEPQVIKTPRTAPPKAPPPGKSRPLPSIVSRPPAPASAEPKSPARASLEPKSPARASLEKSVSRVFSPPTPAGKPRPLPRMARGTETPHPNAGARPTRPQLAQGSTRLPAMRDPSHDVTATDITAVDRARASMRDDEDTRVNVVVPPSADITLDVAFDQDAEVENTMVDGKPNGVAIVSVSEGSPLPRLTARLRRHSVPN